MPKDIKNFDRLSEKAQRTNRFFTCLCKQKIYVSQNPPKRMNCSNCNNVWKIHKEFVSGLNQNKGIQLSYETEGVY